MSHRALWSLLILMSLVFLPSSQGQALIPRDVQYHLRPGDVIEVQYRFTPEYNAVVAIQPDGFASLPLVGNRRFQNLTLTEAQTLLVKYAQDRLNDPEITVILKEFEKPHYIVGGEVGTPGRYDLHGRVTVLQAIEMAGGFRTTGKTSQILLIRRGDGEAPETRLINLKGILNKRQVTEDVDLKSGDMLIVPKTKIASIEPYIRLLNSGFYLSPSSF